MRVDDALRFNDSPPFVSESETLRTRAANLLALPIMKERQSGFMHLPALTKRRQVTKTRNVKSCPREANGGEIKPPCALELMNWQRLVKWLNETFPIRVLVAFASVLAAVVLWKALEGLVG